MISFAKSEKKKVEQVLPWVGGITTSESGKDDMGKGFKRVDIGKYCVNMNVNGKKDPC
jgi:hypothetical protein